MAAKGFSLIDSLVANFLWATVSLSLLTSILKNESARRAHQQYQTAVLVAQQLQEFLHFSAKGAHQITHQLAHFSPDTDCPSSQHTTTSRTGSLRAHICQLIPSKHRPAMTLSAVEGNSGNALASILLIITTQYHTTPIRFTLTRWEQASH